MSSEIEIKNSKINVNIYKYYAMFAYDWLFYYAIEVLYLTIVKGFTMSHIMYISSFYAFFSFIWQLCGNFILEKLGLKRSIIFGNIFVIANVCIYLFGNGFGIFIFANFLGSLGFSLKSLAEGTILYSSLKTIGKRESYSKVEGSANAKYHYLNAVTAILSGFLFTINPYIPVVLCLVCSIVSFYISTKFKNVENKEEEEPTRIKDIIKEFGSLMKSNRSKSIFLFAFVFYGVISVANKLYKALLIDLAIGNEYITIIVCLYTIFVGIGAKSLFYIEKITKNKTLTIFVYFFMIAMLFVGVIGVNGTLSIYSLSILMLSLVVMGLIQGAYRVAIKKYVMSFTTSKIRTKIMAAYYMFENLGTTLILLVSGFLLEFMSNSIACIIFVASSFLVLLLVLRYMKNRIGLKPEQYDPKDINNVKV